MERWGLFEALLGNRLSIETITAVEKMDSIELREGVLEFLFVKLNQVGRR